MAKQISRFNKYLRKDTSSIKQRANARSGDFDSIFKEGVKIFKPREGRNTIRILPPTWEGADHYAFDAYINYGIGIDDQAYLSLSGMRNERDPLAEARKQAERQGNKELADSLRPTRRALMYVVDRNAEEEGVQLWSCPFSVDKAFCNLAIDEDSGAAIQVDVPLQSDEFPDDGCDIRFHKEGTGKTTKYPADKMRILKPSPLHEDPEKMAEWIDFAETHQIPNMLNFYDYDHIANVFDGHSGAKPEESPKAVRATKPSQDDDDEAPQRSVGRTTNRAKPTSKPTDDEYYDEETGEIIEKKTNKKASPLPDDEDAPQVSIDSIKKRLAGRRSRTQDDD